MMDKTVPMIFDVNQLEASALNGDGLACYLLGRSYDSAENGVNYDFESALFWYEKGKELDDSRCIYGVGACYYFGDGVTQNMKIAYELFVKAYKPLLELIEAEKNSPEKQAFSKFCLGAYYYFGFGALKRTMR